MLLLKVNKYDLKLFVLYLEHSGDTLHLYGSREGSKAPTSKPLLAGESNFVPK